MLIRTLLILSLVVSALSASESDPRPRILVIGEMSSISIRGVVPWYGAVREQHPEWALEVKADGNLMAGGPHESPGKKKPKVWGSASAQLGDLLTGLPKQNMVIIMLGMNYYRAELRDQVGIEASAKELQDLLASLQAHDVTAEAQLVVVTPPPVVEAKLDQWSVASFTGAEAYGTELAQAWKYAAQASGAAVIDAHDWIKTQGNGGDKVVTAGWMIRWGGIGHLGNWMSEQIAALSPQPFDAEAFAHWQRAFTATQQLNRILAATGGGKPAIGPALAPRAEPEPAADGKKKKQQKGTPPVRVAIPLDTLQDGKLDILVAADGPHLASFRSGSEKKWDRPFLTVTLSDGETKTFPHIGTDWQYLDSARPDELIGDQRFGVSIGKWRPFPLVDGRADSKRDVLMRWTLKGLDPASISEAMLTIPYNSRSGYLQETRGGKAQQLEKPGTYGSFAVHLLTSPDDLWHSEKANWNSLDGTRKWSGGDADTAARTQQIEEFLKTDIPAAVAEKARSYLSP